MSIVTEKLGRVHMDLWGPVELSLRGMKYMLTITDQATGRVWVYFSKDKKPYCREDQGLSGCLQRQNAKSMEKEKSLEQYDLIVEGSS